MVRKGRQPEGILQKKIIAYLERKGFVVWGNKNGATYNPTRKCFMANTTVKGISDILGLIPHAGGKFLAIEVKLPKKYPTPDQKAFLKRINDNNGIGFVARSIEDCDKHLAQYWDFTNLDSE